MMLIRPSTPHILVRTTLPTPPPTPDCTRKIIPKAPSKRMKPSKSITESPPIQRKDGLKNTARTRGEGTRRRRRMLKQLKGRAKHKRKKLQELEKNSPKPAPQTPSSPYNDFSSSSPPIHAAQENEHVDSIPPEDSSSSDATRQERGLEQSHTNISPTETHITSTQHRIQDFLLALAHEQSLLNQRTRILESSLAKPTPPILHTPFQASDATHPTTNNLSRSRTHTLLDVTADLGVELLVAELALRDDIEERGWGRMEGRLEEVMRGVGWAVERYDSVVGETSRGV